MNSSNKVAIITGGGTGIGKHSAFALLREGYCVTLAGRRRDPLETAVKEAGSAESQMLVVPTDVSDPASVQALFAKTKDRFGRIDVLFNNAGTGAPSIPMEDLSYEQWQSVVDINLTGTFLCTQEAFKYMKNQHPQGGRIINNGSISSQVPRLNSAPYTATKHGIAGLTKSTALDGRKYDIACGQIDIGNAMTDMVAKMKEGVLQANGSIAVEPTMDPENVAQAVVYMVNLSLDTNVLFMTVMATKMPFVGRG
jgi:NAD(P)-dependent dehydrogenase (short-subunit alcohol dehydrogenase family)